MADSVNTDHSDGRVTEQKPDAQCESALNLYTSPGSLCLQGRLCGEMLLLLRSVPECAPLRALHCMGTDLRHLMNRGLGAEEENLRLLPETTPWIAHPLA
jgi:hypothetical protein